MAEQEEWSLDSILETALGNSQATSRTDAIVVAIHSCLIADRFYLVAIGDEGFENGRYSKESVALSSPNTPELPRGWNTSPDVYTFQYKQTLTSDRVCLVKALPIGDQIIINVLCSNKPNDVLTVSLSIDHYTNPITYSGANVSMNTFKNILKLFTTINKEINSKIKIDRQSTKGMPPVKDTPPVRNTPTTRHYDERHDPLRVGGPRRPLLQDPFSYGQGDLSPFGGPGGMMMDPFRQGGLRGPLLGPHPPGFVPPGARYDPVSPFGPNLGHGRGRGGYGGQGMYGPDPDHLPPPGSDDMFS